MKNPHICMNKKCYDGNGCCDFCEARCPYSTNLYSLILALHTTPEGKKIIKRANEIAIARILAGEEP